MNSEEEFYDAETGQYTFGFFSRERIISAFCSYSSDLSSHLIAFRAGIR